MTRYFATGIFQDTNTSARTRLPMTHGTAPRVSLQVHVQHRRLRQVTTDEAALYPSLLALQSGPRLLGFLGLYGPVAQSGERRPRMAEVTSSSLVGSTPKTYRFAA